MLGRVHGMARDRAGQWGGMWDFEDIPNDRDHVELPEDYLVQAQEKYKFQASHPVDEGLRGGHSIAWRRPAD